MTDSSPPSFVRIARMGEEFPGQLATFKPALKGLIPDEVNFTEDSYDEIFAILVSAIYYVKDAGLRRSSANESGGNPKLVAMLMNEGPKDKDAILAERVLDRIAPYVPPKVFLATLATMYADKSPVFKEYHGAIKRIMSDLFRIASGFEPAKECPKVLLTWASGPNRDAIRDLLLA